MKTKYAIFIGIMLFSLISVSALAQEEKPGAASLDSAFAHAKCKADFTVGVLNSYATNLPNASALKQNADKLQADLTKLEGFEKSSDVDGYKDFLKGTFDPDLKAARDAVQDVRKAGNFTNETRTALKTSYEQLRATYDGCSFDSLKKVANKKVDRYNRDLERYTDKIAKLGEKGLETDEMTKVIQNAKTQVILPLQAAIDATNDTKSLRATQEKYCLYSGCKDGFNFHLEARFEIAKLDAMLTQVKAKAGNLTNATNLNEKIAKAQTDLDVAKSLLEKTGASNYKEGRGSEVWSKIRDVSKDIREIYNAIRKEQNEKRKEGLEKRKEEVKEKREEIKGKLGNLTNLTKQLKQEVKEKKEEVKQKIEEAREEFKNETNMSGKGNGKGRGR